MKKYIAVIKTRDIIPEKVLFAEGDSLNEIQEIAKNLSNDFAIHCTRSLQENIYEQGAYNVYRCIRSTILY